MVRMACVDVAALPLQLLLVEHRDWARQPVAVVERDRPQAMILWVNEEAWRRGVRPGQRYASGLALASGLRAGVVPRAKIAAQVLALTERLRRFSPDIEAASGGSPADVGEAGVFWLSATGLEPLYPSLTEWAQEVRRDLQAIGFQSSVVVGFTRFGTYAVAHGRARRRGGQGRVTVFGSAEQERRMAKNVPLKDFDLNFGLLLDRLGVCTVGAFVDLPADGIRLRLGKQAHRFYQMASEDLVAPLQPQPAPVAVRGRTELEWAETDVHRLLFRVNRELQPLLGKLSGRGEALRELELRFDLEDADEWCVRVRPAEPTLDARQILNLLHLRLEREGLLTSGPTRGKLPGGVTAIGLEVRSARATAAQLELFGQTQRRDLRAADRALARLRAEFGSDTVVQARLLEGHLPEARFAWEPLSHIVRPAVREVAARPLVRRLLERPQRSNDLLRPRGGPYVVAGGWWRTPIHREYYYNETADGELLWTYYDRQRQCWFVQGRVE